MKNARFALLCNGQTHVLHHFLDTKEAKKDSSLTMNNVQSETVAAPERPLSLVEATDKTLNGMVEVLRENQILTLGETLAAVPTHELDETSQLMEVISAACTEALAALMNDIEPPTVMLLFARAQTRIQSLKTTINSTELVNPTQDISNGELMLLLQEISHTLLASIDRLWDPDPVSE